MKAKDFLWPFLVFLALVVIPTIYRYVSTENQEESQLQQARNKAKFVTQTPSSSSNPLSTEGSSNTKRTTTPLQLEQEAESERLQQDMLRASSELPLLLEKISSYYEPGSSDSQKLREEIQSLAPGYDLRRAREVLAEIEKQVKIQESAREASEANARRKEFGKLMDEIKSYYKNKPNMREFQRVESEINRTSPFSDRLDRAREELRVLEEQYKGK